MVLVCNNFQLYSDVELTKHLNEIYIQVKLKMCKKYQKLFDKCYENPADTGEFLSITLTIKTYPLFPFVEARFFSKSISLVFVHFLTIPIPNLQVR